MTPELDRNRAILEQLSREYWTARGYVEYKKEACPNCLFSPEAMKPITGGLQCPCGKEIAPGQFLEWQAFRKEV